MDEVNKKEEAAKKLASWAAEGQEHTLPEWGELPSIPLYMDQVIFYLNDVLSMFKNEDGSELLTGSMVNNYVKNGVLPHPEKKKYTKEHMGALAAMCMLKPVLSIQDIKTLLTGKELSPELYELFREAHTAAVASTCAELKDVCESGGSLREEALRLAVRANAQRAAAQKILQELGESTI